MPSDPKATGAVFAINARTAAMIGREAFLLPLISTLPLSAFPPLMMKLSIVPVLGETSGSSTDPSVDDHFNVVRDEVKRLSEAWWAWGEGNASEQGPN